MFQVGNVLVRKVKFNMASWFRRAPSKKEEARESEGEDDAPRGTQPQKWLNLNLGGKPVTLGGNPNQIGRRLLSRQHWRSTAHFTLIWEMFSTKWKLSRLFWKWDRHC